MSKTRAYICDLSVGDTIVHEGESCVIEDMEPIPPSESDYYGMAKPDRWSLSVRFGDGAHEEFTRWETDVVVKEDK